MSSIQFGSQVHGKFVIGTYELTQFSIFRQTPNSTGASMPVTPKTVPCDIFLFP